MAAILRRFLAICLIWLAAFAPAQAGFWVWDSGAWRAVQHPYVWDAGAWRAVQNGWVWDSGSWHKFFTACTPATFAHDSGSGSDATPAGAVQLIVQVVGGGAQGGSGFNDGMGGEFSGGGASGGGYAVKTISSPSGSYSWSVGVDGSGGSQGGTSSASGSAISMSATGGFPGGTANFFSDGVGATSVGSASGGDSNFNGNVGLSGGGGSGGAGGTSAYGGGYGKGGDGGNPFSGGAFGTPGRVVLTFTC